MTIHALYTRPCGIVLSICCASVNLLAVERCSNLTGGKARLIFVTFARSAARLRTDLEGLFSVNQTVNHCVVQLENNKGNGLGCLRASSGTDPKCKHGDCRDSVSALCMESIAQFNLVLQRGF